LHAAASNGHAEIVKALLKAGAQVNIQSKRGSSTPEISSRCKHVNTLAASTADVPASIRHSRTVLSPVAKEAVLRPLTAKADANTLSTPLRQTALQLAEEGGHLQVVAQLVRAGARKTS